MESEDRDYKVGQWNVCSQCNRAIRLTEKGWSHEGLVILIPHMIVPRLPVHPVGVPGQ